jgi:peptide deformylase
VEVICYPHPTLRYPAKPVQRVDKELREVIAEMFRLMYEHKGVGLAANQVGVPLRLFVMNEAGKQGQGKELVFINPVITKPRGNEEMEEGCLSLPHMRLEIYRKPIVKIEYYDENWDLYEEELDGFPARVVQHEYDHLEGILISDRVSPMKRTLLKSKLNNIDKMAGLAT